MPTPWKTQEKELQHTDDPFARFQREFHQLAENFWNSDLPDFFQNNGIANPRVEVKTDDDRITVNAELPGVEEKDIDLKIEKNRLVLSGEKKNEVEEQKQLIKIQ